MKSIVVILLSVLLFGQEALALTEPVEVSSQVQEVTVFLRGAQVTRMTRVSLQKGESTLAFRELPVNIDPQSVQARGEGNFTILSILHQVNYLAGQRRTAEVRLLQDSLRFYEDKHALVIGMQAVSKSEEELLVANRDLGGRDKGVAVTELKLAVDFHRTRLIEIKKEQIRLAREATNLNQIIEKLRNQLNTLNAGINKPTSEVLVNITAPENSSASVWISYTVYDAGWIPEYDIRAKDVQSPVMLVYNARVFQNSGEDWENVPLRLSTANPQQRGEKPDLQPWFIDFEQPFIQSEQYNAIRGVVTMKYAAPVILEEEAASLADDATTVASLTEISENQTNLEFVIKIPYDIPSDNKQYTINIQENTLPATYEYFCAPKLDREAFLVARITGWENLNLLSGEINLFFEGTYVGKSNLNVRNTSDTLDLSLGRDKGIVVTRVKIQDFTAVRTIGSNIRESRAWDITVRNNKKQPIDLHLVDQFPVSMNKDIEIESLELSGGSYNRETGRITWKIILDPSAEKKLKLAFAIKYPKDKKIYID